MTELMRSIYELGVIPVIKIESAEVAVPLAKALCAGGLPAAEITFRTSCAAEAIQAVRQALPNMLVGAGTVLTPEQVDAASDAGAAFIVSPGLNPRVVRRCVDIGIPVFPGCATPSDVEAALEMGLTVVKFFPAESAGGTAMLRALSAPYGNVYFLPTGGIDEENLPAYLTLPCVLACGGSFMVSESLIRAKHFEAVTELTRRAVRRMLGLTLAHVGINYENVAAARRAAAIFTAMFGVEAKIPDGMSGCFVDGMIELIGSDGRGTNGHIAIGTNSVARAEAYFSRMGFAFAEESRSWNEQGRLRAVYFADELSGFAFHLVQK